MQGSSTPVEHLVSVAVAGDSAGALQDKQPQAALDGVVGAVGVRPVGAGAAVPRPLAQLRQVAAAVPQAVHELLRFPHQAVAPLHVG